MILLAGAAFTVTARQQQRTLATIASVGATRRCCSASSLARHRARRDRWHRRGRLGSVRGPCSWRSRRGGATQYYGFHLHVPLMLAIAVFAVFIGWVAALMPARNASRFDIVAALRGRTPTTHAERPSPLSGLILLGVGLAITLGGGVPSWPSRSRRPWPCLDGSR